MRDVTGPSYWDVSAYCENFRSRWGKDVSFRVCPPVRVQSTGKWSSWHVWCEVRDTPGYGGPCTITGASYGQGGAWATLPAAMFDALGKADDQLSEKEKAATRVAAF